MRINKILLFPKFSINEFKFGENINSYIDKYNFFIEKCDIDEIPKWDTYSLIDLGVNLFIEDEIIVSISCTKSLVFNDIELIGNNISSLIKIFGHYSEKDELYLAEEETPHNVYDFDSYGIQIWEKNNKIDSIFCSIGDNAD